MEATRNEPKPNTAVIDEPELVLDEDEQIQLAKFLDALLEADMTNKSNERKKDEANWIISQIAYWTIYGRLADRNA